MMVLPAFQPRRASVYDDTEGRLARRRSVWPCRGGSAGLCGRWNGERSASRMAVPCSLSRLQQSAALPWFRSAGFASSPSPRTRRIRPRRDRSCAPCPRSPSHRRLLCAVMHAEQDAAPAAPSAPEPQREHTRTQSWLTRARSYASVVVRHTTRHTGVGIVCAVAYFDP